MKFCLFFPLQPIDLVNTLPYPNNPNFVAALWAKVAATGGLKSEGNIKISSSQGLLIVRSK